MSTAYGFAKECCFILLCMVFTVCTIVVLNKVNLGNNFAQYYVMAGLCNQVSPQGEVILIAVLYIIILYNYY